MHFLCNKYTHALSLLILQNLLILFIKYLHSKTIYKQYLCLIGHREHAFHRVNKSTFKIDKLHNRFHWQILREKSYLTKRTRRSGNKNRYSQSSAVCTQTQPTLHLQVKSPSTLCHQAQHREGTDENQDCSTSFRTVRMHR